MAVDRKREYGQYFTTDSTWLKPHISSHLQYLSEKYTICFDPFAGDGHLLKIAKKFDFKLIGCDIDSDICINNKWNQNDSLRNLDAHKDTFILTNPPYLAKNSAKRLGSEMVSYFSRDVLENQSDSEYKILDDLFKIAITKGIDSYEDSIWIVPESGIQDLEKLPQWKNNLHSVTILEKNPFGDTEHPVCVMIFSRSNPKHEVWKNDVKLGYWTELYEMHQNFTQNVAKHLPMKFNDKFGNLGFRAVDGTREDGSMKIKFCLADDLGYPRESIKISSRHLTYISVDLTDEELSNVISIANELIDDYRAMTHDVFLTAFMGNNKQGARRRRLDYKLARVIFNKAYQELKHRKTIES